MSNKDKLTRRNLIKVGGGAALLGATVKPAFAGPEAKKTLASLPKVPRKVLGKTKKEVPILLFGGAVKLDKRFDPKRHGRWMLWSFALTCSAITLRVILIPMIIARVPFATAYPIAAWSGFSVNLLLLELVLFAKQKRRQLVTSMALDRG